MVVSIKLAIEARHVQACRHTPWSTVMKRRAKVFVAFWSLLVGVIAGIPAVSAQDKTLTVFAAASMKNALDDANAAYTKKSGIKVVTSYAASSALMKQIEQ